MCSFVVLLARSIIDVPFKAEQGKLGEGEGERWFSR